uniref:Sodium/potassium-transporting ATPase subunit beta n=1 Tax=Scleropages formosus TaxID=113540 RepID=A0A8C9SZS3_SCLFO
MHKQQRSIFYHPQSSHRTPLLPISTNSNGAEHLFNDTETTRVTTTHLSPFNILLWSITMATRTISATATVAVAEVRRSVAFGCLAALLAVAALTLCVTLQALVLCHFLDTHREEYSMEDKSIIELGAGTGLVSIVTALLVYISLYYVAFYVVMTSLFALAIYVLMSTLNPYTPDYQDRLTSPGVMVWPDTYGEEDVEISFNSSDRKSWSRMSNCLKDFLQPYNKSQQLQVNIQDCKWGTYFFQKDFEGPDHTKQSCVFYRSMLGNCSGMSDPTFGYSDGTPCVIIKMNRIINFLPDNRSGKTPYVNCTLLEGSDSVSHIEYFPANGTMDLAYFPYYGKKAQPTYMNPLVAVKFHLKGRREAKVQCRVVANNIAYENFHDPYEGKVIFYLRASA